MVKVRVAVRTGRRSNRQRKWHVREFVSCKVTRAIRNVRGQPESLCWRPAVVNLFRPVKFLRWVLGQGSLLPLSQGEAFTLASISYLAILVKYILAKKKKIQDHSAAPKNYAWHQWRNTGCVFVTRYLLAIFGHMLDWVPVRIWPRTFTFELYKKSLQDHRLWLQSGVFLLQVQV